jgi:glycosyltransferase involved in cell wall biosynthesis
MRSDLTLIVTAHRPPFLAEALYSVATQTTQNFDLICCADVRHGDEVLRCFVEHWPSLSSRTKRLLPISGNGTAGYVRNRGFAAATTEWVAYLDGDDFLRADAIEVLLKAIDDDPREVRVFSTGMVRIHDDGREEPCPNSLTYLPPLWIYEIDPDTVEHVTYFNQLQAIRRCHWEEYPYDETTNGEDIDFMLHQLLLGRFMKIPEYLYYFRDTPGSFSKSAFVGGDICTQRYRQGYYATLLQRYLKPALLSNFRHEAPTGGASRPVSGLIQHSE